MRIERRDILWRGVLAGFLAVAGFFLVTERAAHVFGVLPYLLVLLCPAMHMFLHRHGKHPAGAATDMEEQR